MVRNYLIVLLLSATAFSGWAAQDPTAPLGWVKPKVQAPKTKKRAVKKQPLPALQSIICRQATSCYAIINDQLVSSGEEVSSYTIQTITEESVTLFRGGKRWTLELFSLDFKE